MTIPRTSLLAAVLLVFLGTRVSGGELALDDRQRKFLRAIQPDFDFEHLAFKQGRNLVHFSSSPIGAGYESVLLLTSAMAPDQGAYEDQSIEARLLVLRTRGQDWEVVDSESLEMPFGVGTREATLDTSTYEVGPEEKALAVTLGRKSDGEGSSFQLSLFRFHDGSLYEILSARYEPNSGSGYPATSSALQVVSVPGARQGPYEFQAILTSSLCEDSEAPCTERREVRRFCGSGNGYERRTHCLVRNVSASSTLAPGRGGQTYEPENTLDEDRTTAWAESAKGPGKGEWLRFDFHEPLPLEALTLVGGYSKSDKHWKDNARIKHLRIHFSESGTQDVRLSDQSAEQEIALKTRGPVEWLRLEILDVYKGRKYEDGCVSEVGFRLK